MGGSVNGAADVYSDDGLWRMFFASPAPALSRRARRSLYFSADGGDAGAVGLGGEVCTRSFGVFEIFFYHFVFALDCWPCTST